MYATIKATSTMKPIALLLWILAIELQVKHSNGGTPSCEEVSKICKLQLQQLSPTKYKTGRLVYKQTSILQLMYIDTTFHSLQFNYKNDLEM